MANTDRNPETGLPVGLEKKNSPPFQENINSLPSSFGSDPLSCAASSFCGGTALRVLSVPFKAAASYFVRILERKSDLKSRALSLSNKHS